MRITPWTAILACMLASACGNESVVHTHEADIAGTNNPTNPGTNNPTNPGTNNPTNPNQCDPSAFTPTCDGNNAVSCAQTGTLVSTQCEGPCVAGQCTCESGFRPICSGNAVISCGSNGKYQSTSCPKACIGGECSDSYSTAEIAPSLASADLKAYLGPQIIDNGVNFAVYSEHATQIEVLLFSDAAADTPTIRVPMKKQSSNIWTAFVLGIGEGQHYGYIAFGPNWTYDAAFQPGSSTGFHSDCDDQGNRFNPNKLLIDPYAKKLSGDADSTKGSPNTGNENRTKSSWGSTPKSVVATSRYKWSDNETSWRSNRQKGDAFENHAVNDLVYYEVHPKGFTKSASKLKDLNLTITAPGTWRGIGEMAPYLKDLGINALELMPVAEKQDSDTYWGYNTINYFAPDITLSADAKSSNDTGAAIDEFKWMVDQLHQNDIELIIDVVYGQTGEGGISARAQKNKIDCQDPDYMGYYYDINPNEAALLSFRGLDNSAYYILENFYYETREGDNCQGHSIPNAAYLNQTGVGNQTRSNYGPFRQLILDSMHYWVEEMHVDGFRVDLASVLGVPEDHKYGDTTEWFNTSGNTMIKTIIDDSILQKYNTRIIAEPWDSTRYALGGFPKSSNKPGYAWSEWNGRFRDMIKRFVNFDDYSLASQESIPPSWSGDMNLGNLFTGSSVLFGDDGRAPYNSVNYITAHDGFTLYDLVTYEDKINGCGKLNPVCCTDPTLLQCIFTGGSDDNAGRNWCAFGYNGDEAHRNDNGRCDNPGNEALKRQMMRNFFTLLLFTNGSPMIYGGDELMRTLYGNNNAYGAVADNEYNWLRWDEWQNNDDAVRMRDFVKTLIHIRKNFRAAVAQTTYDYSNLVWKGANGGDADWSSKNIGMYYRQTGSMPALFIMINMEADAEINFALPEPGEWNVLVDTQQYFDDGLFANDPGASKRTTHNAATGGLYLASGSYGVKPRSIVIISK